MDDDFAFSSYRTREEWDEENRRREEFNREFNRRWEERQQCLARGEQVDDDFDFDWVDSLNSKSSETASAETDASGETVQ
jgi:2-polyprenyl-6-methoxyphenol hydroxylase-like FAD-dependent oxidoreductase